PGVQPTSTHLAIWQLVMRLGRITQAMPQAPQLAGDDERSVSQPLATIMSQLPKPALHDPTTHAPDMQAATALGSGAQAEPQALQFLGSVCVLTSQPLPGMPSQSRNACRHEAMEHWPSTHSALALGVMHALLQAPQFLMSLARPVSHPSEGSLLQSSKPG